MPRKRKMRMDEQFPYQVAWTDIKHVLLNHRGWYIDIQLRCKTICCNAISYRSQLPIPGVLIMNDLTAEWYDNPATWIVLFTSCDSYFFFFFMEWFPVFSREWNRCILQHTYVFIHTINKLSACFLALSVCSITWVERNRRCGIFRPVQSTAFLILLEFLSFFLCFFLSCSTPTLHAVLESQGIPVTGSPSPLKGYHNSLIDGSPSMT